MKEEELRKHATCDLCGKKIGESGSPLFWTFEIKRWGIKMDAVQRQQGLAMMLDGHGSLAMAMGPDEDMAEELSRGEVTVCEKCFFKYWLPLVDKEV